MTEIKLVVLRKTIGQARHQALGPTHVKGFVEYNLLDMEARQCIVVLMADRASRIEIRQRIHCKKMLVGRINESPHGTEIRHDDLDLAAHLADAMNFLENPHWMVEML